MFFVELGTGEEKTLYWEKRRKEMSFCGTISREKLDQGCPEGRGTPGKTTPSGDRRVTVRVTRQESGVNWKTFVLCHW